MPSLGCNIGSPLWRRTWNFWSTFATRITWTQGTWPVTRIANRRGECNVRLHSMNTFAAAVAMLAALLLASFPAQGQQGKKGGPVPRTSEGKVDLGGVWIISDSTDLPTDPAYLSAMQKLYAERKASGAKGDPEKLCLPNGVVRIEPLPYKIVQTPKLVILLSEGNTHSYRRIFIDGRTHNLELEPNTWNGDSIGHWED